MKDLPPPQTVLQQSASLPNTEGKWPLTFRAPSSKTQVLYQPDPVKAPPVTLFGAVYDVCKKVAFSLSSRGLESVPSGGRGGWGASYITEPLRPTMQQATGSGFRRRALCSSEPATVDHKARLRWANGFNMRDMVYSLEVVCLACVSVFLSAWVGGGREGGMCNSV